MTKDHETIFSHIDERRKSPWQGEEEVRRAWLDALEKGLGIKIHAERDRVDGSYNNILIEFKSPGLFNASKESPAFKKATETQLVKYAKKKAKAMNRPTSDFHGIAIDGDHACLCRFGDDGKIVTGPLHPFSVHSVGLVAEVFKSDTRRAVATQNLVDDFGHGSQNAQSLMQSMADALAYELAQSGKSKVKMLFEEWKTLYGQVADMSKEQKDSINKEICFSWNGNKATSLSGRLFVIHTYNSLLIKLLAAEIVAAHGLTSMEAPAQAMVAFEEDSSLLDFIQKEIEGSALFSQANILGFVEEPIFSWYLDVARTAANATDIVQGLRDVLITLATYLTDRLEHTRDVLRDLYQELVPGKLRQSLGEFYTPDWLVDFTISKAENGPWLGKRVLDPTCGSGAFLIAIVRLMREEAQKGGLSAREILDHLCDNVWGFDLNPLAVQTARVNFLMEIADLLRQEKGHLVEMPVLLADAIYSPAPDPEKGNEVVEYTIGSQVAGLTITLPAKLAEDRVRLDDVFQQMSEDIEHGKDGREYDEAEQRLVAAQIVTAEEAEEWREPLGETYNKILELHRQNWNGIWFRIVRNFFWSATAGEFDCIVGNPPWVRWSKLPEAYRERVKPTCDQYGIFSKTKYHGGNELDISAMITYTTADKWLKNGGRLAFVVTGRLFQNASSAGFRDFKLHPYCKETKFLNPIGVDDMGALKPFPDASNYTTVVAFDKADKPGTYPVPYRKWNRANGKKTIKPDLSLKEVLDETTIDTLEATPVGGNSSPWAVLSIGRFPEMKKVRGACKWTDGRKGITADLNGVFFVPINNVSGDLVEVQSRPEAGRKKIGAVKTAWVEPTIMYPIIKGAGDISACYLNTEAPKKADSRLYTFLPNRGITKKEYAECETAMNRRDMKKTKEWFNGFKELLEDRSTYKRQMKGAPIYAVYNVGDYTFKPWKVVWPEQAENFRAAVAHKADVPGVGEREYVPDHKVYFAAFDDKESAYFLCGLLNCPLVTEWIEGHTVKVQIGNIFKYLDLPRFDASDKSHEKFVKLVESAHAEHDSRKRRAIVKSIVKAGEAILDSWKK